MRETADEQRDRPRRDIVVAGELDLTDTLRLALADRRDLSSREVFVARQNRCCCWSDMLPRLAPHDVAYGFRADVELGAQFVNRRASVVASTKVGDLLGCQFGPRHPCSNDRSNSADGTTVPPAFAARHNHLDQGARYPKPSSQIIQRHRVIVRVLGPDFDDLSIGEFCTPVVLTRVARQGCAGQHYVGHPTAVRVSASQLLVAFVFLSGSGSQVSGIHAEPVVARVQDVKSRFNRSIGQFVGNAMRGFKPRGNATRGQHADRGESILHVATAESTTGPEPARVGLLHLRPEALKVYVAVEEVVFHA